MSAYDSSSVDETVDESVEEDASSSGTEEEEEEQDASSSSASSSGSEEEKDDESDESGQSIVPSDAGDDEDDEDGARRPAAAGGLLGYLGLGTAAATAAPAVSDEDDAAYAYDFEADLPLQDETYDFGDDAPPGDEDELEEGLKDDRLQKRLEMAYAFSTKDGGDMGVRHFRQAVAMMGKVFTKEETDQFFDEAVVYERDPKALGNSTERDDRGLLKRNDVLPPRGRAVLSRDGFVAFFERYMTRTVDPREAAEHFRALVEGAAEQALRGDAGGAGADGTPAAAANDELRAMKDTKHIPITKIFIYAKDLRRVMVAFSEKLTDEEADAFVRECKPAALPGAGDGGLERVYFHQYLTMLKDDS